MSAGLILATLALAAALAACGGGGDSGPECQVAPEHTADREYAAWVLMCPVSAEGDTP